MNEPLNFDHEEFDKTDEDNSSAEMELDENQDEDDLDGNEDQIQGVNATPVVNIKESIERLDALLAETVDENKLRAGIGIRLALGMAQELKSGLPLGTETGELVTAWLEVYGQETVDAGVAIARQFLIKPEDMRKALGQRLGMGDVD
jgi:hypothetical protein